MSLPPPSHWQQYSGVSPPPASPLAVIFSPFTAVPLLLNVTTLAGMHQDLSDGMAALSASISALNGNHLKGTETIVLVSFQRYGLDQRLKCEPSQRH